MGLKKYAAVQADDCILNVQWAGDHLCVTPVTGAILVVDKEGEITSALPDHGLGNGASSATPDLVATCGFDGRVRLHSLPACEAVAEVKLGRSVIERVVWSPDGQHLAVGFGKNLLILDRKGETVATFGEHQTSVTDAAWNPKNAREVASVSGGGARMWRLGATEPFAKFDWGGASLSVAWSPDGRWLVTGDQTASVHLYDFNRDYPLHIQGYETKVKAMAFSPDGKRLATGGSPMVTVWDCTPKNGPEGSTPGQLQFHQGDVEAIAWSPDGKYLATGDILGRLVLSANDKPVSAFQGENNITSLAWNADSTLLAVGDGDGLVVVFQAV